MKETWPESFSEIGLRLEWWRESTGKIMTVVLAHESHAPLAPVSFLLSLLCMFEGGVEEYCCWAKDDGTLFDFPFRLSSFLNYWALYLIWRRDFFSSVVECSSFQVLVGQEIITYLLPIGRTTELLLCWMAAMLGSSRCWIQSLVCIFFPPSGVHLSSSSGPDEKVGTDFPRWKMNRFPFPLIALHVARHNHIRSIPFCRVLERILAGCIQSNPSSRAFNPLPPSLLIQPLILLGHGPPPGAHYLIENYSARRAPVSNYRCRVSKIIFLVIFFLDNSAATSRFNQMLT